MRIASLGFTGFTVLCMFGCGDSGSDAAGTTPTAKPTATTAPTTTPTTTPTTPPAPTTTGTTPPPPAGNPDPEAYTITLYAIPAPSSLLNPNGISWDSPGALVRGALVNEGGSYIGFNHTIGHAGVRVQCDAFGSNAPAHFQGSMTNVNESDFNNLVVTQQVGLGMLIDNVPGMIEPEASLQASVDDRIANGRMSFIRFQIDAQTCHDLIAYEAAYAASNVQKNYGLMARPLYKEGAGCSAFSMSFLELADLIEPRFTAGWSFTVRIPLWTSPLLGSPEALIGGTAYPANRVPVTRLTTLTRDWAKPTEDGVDLFGWDPTKMYNWIDQRAATALVDKSEPVEIKGKVKGLVLDRRTKAATPLLKTRTFFKI